MSKHRQTIIFLGIIIAVAIFSRVAYPKFYPILDASSVTSGTGEASLSADVPLLVLPSQASSSATGTSSGGATSVDSPGATNSTGIPSDTISTSFGSGTTPPFAEVGHVLPPPIVDEASLIADVQTGDVFLSANADVRWPMASITKLMTASIVVDNMNLNQAITVPPEAVAVDPTEKDLNVGDTYTVGDLLKVLLLPSSNVAAETLADYYGRTRFLALMNARAQAWGMTSTYYDDPSGLSAANESTPDDLLKLAQHIYTQYPQILAITRTPQVTIVNPDTGKSAVVTSINNFAGRPDFIGGKTGYTDQADGNLLSIFDYENRPVLVLVMGTDDSSRFNNALALYNWFAANFK